MTKIYEQRDAAFSRVSAYVVARNGERVPGDIGQGI